MNQCNRGHTQQTWTWKPNPIIKLHVQNGEDIIPDVNDFQNFKDIVGRSTEAVGLSWVWKAMEYLQFWE